MVRRHCSLVVDQPLLAGSNAVLGQSARPDMLTGARAGQLARRNMLTSSVLGQPAPVSMLTSSAIRQN
jgi:hypothetical protein